MVCTFPPPSLTSPSHLPFLPPSHWRWCRAVHTSCAAFEMFSQSKSDIWFSSPRHQPVAVSLQLPTFTLHPSCVIIISTCQALMLQTQRSLIIPSLMHQSIHPPFFLPSHVGHETRREERTRMCKQGRRLHPRKTSCFPCRQPSGN